MNLNSSYIAYYKHNYKNFVLNLIPKYKNASICNEEDMIKFYSVLEEVENYYKECSCLEEEDICLMLDYLITICNE
jgi:hypothetical protein